MSPAMDQDPAWHFEAIEVLYSTEAKGEFKHGFGHAHKMLNTGHCQYSVPRDELANDAMHADHKKGRQRAGTGWPACIDLNCLRKVMLTLGSDLTSELVQTVMKTISYRFTMWKPLLLNYK
jgi:hypothetical protein